MLGVQTYLVGAIQEESYRAIAFFDFPGKTLRGGAPKITKLVYNSNNYGLWYL